MTWGWAGGGGWSCQCKVAGVSHKGKGPILLLPMALAWGLVPCGAQHVWGRGGGQGHRDSCGGQGVARGTGTESYQGGWNLMLRLV